MKWLRFLYDILRVVLEFFGIKKKEQKEIQEKFDEEYIERVEEVDEQVEKADDDELVDIAIDSGLVQGSSPSATSKCTSRPKRSRFKSGKHLIE